MHHLPGGVPAWGAGVGHAVQPHVPPGVRRPLGEGALQLPGVPVRAPLEWRERRRRRGRRCWCWLGWCRGHDDGHGHGVARPSASAGSHTRSRTVSISMSNLAFDE